MPVFVKGIIIPNFLFHEIPDLVLLGVQLDYQLFINRHGDFFPIRHSLDCSLKVPFIQLQPAGHTVTGDSFEVLGDQSVLTAFFLEGDNITRFYLIGRYSDFSAVDLKMIMTNKCGAPDLWNRQNLNDTQRYPDGVPAWTAGSDR